MARRRTDRWNDDDEGTGISGLDLMTLALLGFIFMIIVLLPHINPPAKKAAEDITVIENVIVQISWPNEIDADVDLWCQAPGDTPVGYSNLGARVFNLMRDDLGRLYEDPLDVNLEECKGRGIIPGEYTINIHLFSNASGRLPIPVNIVVSTKPVTKTGAKAQPAKPLLTAKESLYYIKEEITVFRFQLTEEGEVVEGSLHNLYKPIREAGRR